MLLGSVASDSGIPALAVTESAKLIPWIVGNRKVARGWVKVSSIDMLQPPSY
jgi:nucleolar complex protein 2